MSKLEVLHLEKVIKKTKIIHDISLEIQSGEVVG
ncbi:ABC transporter ATP-binding protein, partial [Campylobacter upsaliensis]|nr:ABC transporter ATP-binding protein [Campylobacter upsaliensis]